MRSARDLRILFASNRFGPFEISIELGQWIPLNVAQTRGLFNPERVDVDLVIESLWQGHDVRTEIFVIRKREVSA